MLGWMGLIYFLSAQTAPQSSQLSGGMIEAVVKAIFPNADASTVESTVAELQFIVRKGAHFIAYTVLGLLSCMAFITYKIPLPVKGAIGFTVAVLYSVADEYHQTFIPGRSGELRDILIDSCGALLGAGSCVGIYLLIRKRKNRKSKEPKMNKKHYMELCENLRERLQLADGENKFLLEEITALKQQIEKQTEEIGLLKQAAEVAEKPIENAEPPEETDLLEEEEAVSNPVVLPELSQDVNVASKIIGKIVLSAAKHCNNLTALDQSPNVKELVNLILGRSEVAKAEILRISTSQMELGEKVYAMEIECKEAEDYFQSVMAQK